MHIRLLKRDEIEKRRWNGCVYYAPNSLIYAYTWYLDNVCDDWEGLVEFDGEHYVSVFPLVWNSKLFGVKRLYQPYLCQQLGLFSVNGLTQERLEAFLAAIPKEYKYLNINLNDSNELKPVPGYQISEQPNYLLILGRSYDKLKENYSSNLKRNLKKAEKAGLYSTTSIKPEDFVKAVKEMQKAKNNIFPEGLYHAAHRIIYNCLHRGQGVIMASYNAEHELCAAVFWMTNGARIINLLNVTTDAGREVGAMHYLVDLYIRSNAGKPMFMDFEGSSIDSIARFYQSFGAENHPYFNLKQNRLPWWLKWKGGSV